MKVFLVRVQREGRTVKAPGISETELKNEDWLYAADSINDVWDVIEPLRMDPEAHVIGLWEQHPMIQVLSKLPSTESHER